jgi:carbonic anhydrase/acetyltransferase-like protein (isoleucine patch superfamily)
MIKEFNKKKPDIKNAEFVADSADLIGEVVLDKDSSVWYSSVLRADIAKIELGEGSNIQDGTVCHVDYDKPVIIGKGVTIGHNVTLHACKIGDNSLIGMGAVVLDGAIIGEGSLVGAGSLVSPKTIIPPNSLVLGAPAKVKRELNEQELENIKNNAKVYVELAKHHKLV